MIIITSNNMIGPDRITRVIKKMIDKKLLSDNTQYIEIQKNEIKEWTEEAFDALERVIDRK